MKHGLWLWSWTVVPILVAVLLLAMGGCATITDKQDQQEVRIVWHRIDGVRHVPVRKGLGHPEWKAVNGYARMINGVCHVHDRKYMAGQWGTLGHEVKHCFDGGFHD
jgi:hypothetical protein